MSDEQSGGFIIRWSIYACMSAAFMLAPGGLHGRDVHIFTITLEHFIYPNEREDVLHIVN
jgi:hypothetical protein